MLFGFVLVVVVLSSLNKLGLFFVEMKSGGSDKGSFKNGVLGVENEKIENVGL